MMKNEEEDHGIPALIALALVAGIFYVGFTLAGRGTSGVIVGTISAFLIGGPIANVIMNLSHMRALQASIAGGTFNVRELTKLKSAANGSPLVRRTMNEALVAFRPRVEHAMGLPEVGRRAELLALVNEATLKRQSALAAGARDHTDPAWAAAAACETWVQILVLGDQSDRAAAEEFVRDLSA